MLSLLVLLYRPASVLSWVCVLSERESATVREGGAGNGGGAGTSEKKRAGSTDSSDLNEEQNWNLRVSISSGWLWGQDFPLPHVHSDLHPHTDPGSDPDCIVWIFTPVVQPLSKQRRQDCFAAPLVTDLQTVISDPKTDLYYFTNKLISSMPYPLCVFPCTLCSYKFLFQGLFGETYFVSVFWSHPTRIIKTKI